ncbi:acyl-CoA thioesterase [Gabonibacter chumensis]|uniref:acyl-CoA thioesterase n=1 Tax=Gabonibacter chumensis TaxID=2972474 RepID=UPI002573A301|nr:acyl-CoA thioesterase [Gabonibacter chumensis]MCR9010822.1 acyl-CoA thioesterase [Gabonibacter chumensis]
MHTYLFELEMKVRDYECDIQGVVNNANYQHYLEHARHEFLESTGKSFSDLHAQGIDAMVSRVDISYKHSLKGSDRFSVKIALKREGIKLLFFEDIYKIPDNQLCAKGCVEVICLQNGKLTRGEPFDMLFSKELERSEK